jgi:acetyltransferase-like isoleucine patch superfamily enzyme
MRTIVRILWRKLYALYGIRQNVFIGENLHLGIGSILWAPKRLEIGKNVYIGKFCTIECDGSIGDDTVIANNVGFVGRIDHDFRTIGKTLRQAPWVGDPEALCAGKKLSIVVESDVWVGYGSVLISGIKVGRGAIVAAGSVVTKNVAPYAIVAGNPARQIGTRFSEAEVVKHEQLSLNGE